MTQDANASERPRRRFSTLDVPSDARLVDTIGNPQVVVRADDRWVRPGSSAANDAAREDDKGKKKNPHVKWKVAHVEKRNLNGRIYTQPLFERVIRDAKAKGPNGKSPLESGQLCGRLDHPDVTSQGWLSHTCTIWRDLWMESDGSVFGVAEVIIDTEPGKHLAALLDNGAACGASISGRGIPRHPTSEERVKYGLPDAEEEEEAYWERGERPSVIFDDSDDCGYQLLAIDPVDHPAVPDAMAEPTTPEEKQDAATARDSGASTSAQDDAAPATTEHDVTTPPNPAPTVGDDPQAKTDMSTPNETNPAAAPTVADLQADLQQANDTITKLRNALKGRVEDLVAVDGIDLPHREVLPAETADRISGLEQDIADRDASIATLTSDRDTEKVRADTLQQQIDAIATEKAARDALATLLASDGEADSEYADYAPALRRAFDKALAAGHLDFGDDVEAAVKAFCDGKLEEYADLAPKPASDTVTIDPADAGPKGSGNDVAPADEGGATDTADDGQPAPRPFVAFPSRKAS